MFTGNSHNFCESATAHIHILIEVVIDLLAFEDIIFILTLLVGIITFVGAIFVAASEPIENPFLRGFILVLSQLSAHQLANVNVVVLLQLQGRRQWGQCLYVGDHF